VPWLNHIGIWRYVKPGKFPRRRVSGLAHMQ
jgi:hypothetical protein